METCGCNFCLADVNNNVLLRNGSGGLEVFRREMEISPEQAGTQLLSSAEASVSL